MQAAAIGGRFFHYLEACANGDALNFPAFANWNGNGYCYAVRAAQADTANVAEGDGKRVFAFQRRFAVRLFLFNYQRTDLDGVNELDLQFGKFFFRRGVTTEHQRIRACGLAAVVAAVDCRAIRLFGSAVIRLCVVALQREGGVCRLQTNFPPLR